ncbi:MAG: glutathione S-transferase family protein [Nannocystaceae bacterium]
MTLRLYNFARGARGLRALWLCEEMGLECEIVHVSYPQSAEFLALHALGTVPFLEDAGGVAIHESVAILLYLAERYGPTPLLPARDDPAFAATLELTIFGETAIGMPMNPLLADHFEAPAEHKRGWLVGVLERQIGRAFAYLEDRLGEREYLVGDRLTLADLSVACALGLWVGALDGALPERLVAYRERLAARPAYQRARARNNGERASLPSS